MKGSILAGEEPGGRRVVKKKEYGLVDEKSDPTNDEELNESQRKREPAKESIANSPYALFFLCRQLALRQTASL